MDFSLSKKEMKEFAESFLKKNQEKRDIVSADDQSIC